MSNRWSRISWLSNPASESDRISTGNNNDADSVSNRSPEVDSNLLRTLTEVIHDAVQHAIEPLREEIAALRAMVLTVNPERKEVEEPADAQNLPRVKFKRKSLKKRKTSTENHMEDSRTRIRQTDDRDRCTNCLRGVLHCYNVFILILGCGALAVGIWYLVTEYSAREVSVVVGEEWFEVATYLLIGAGGTIALLAFCGCCGTMREDKCVLGFYSGTLTFMFLFLTVSCGMAFYFRRQVGLILTKDIVKHMTDTIEHQYGLDTRTNSNNKLVTDAWDSLQRQLQCCGIQGGENSSFSWSVYKLRSEWYRRNPDQTPYVPSSCCKKNANEKRCTGITRMRAPPAIGPPLGREDLRNPDLNTEGCLDKIREHLLERAIILGLVAGSIPILLAVGIVVSCCLCLKVRRNAEDEEIDL